MEIQVDSSIVGSEFQLMRSMTDSQIVGKIELRNAICCVRSSKIETGIEGTKPKEPLLCTC